MMKRLIFSLVAILVGLLIVIISAVSVGQKRLVGIVGASDESEVADEDVLVEASGSGEVIMKLESLPVGTVGSVDYYLPYPGILPDHPLYMIKMIRDRLKIWTLNLPEEKLEYTLLCADKRIGAALVLVEGGKKQLGVETALKAEQYLFKAVDDIDIVNDQGLGKNLVRAAYKHQEVLYGILSRVEGDEMKLVEEARALNQQVIEKLREKGFGEEQVEVMESSVQPRDPEVEELRGDGEPEMEIGL